MRNHGTPSRAALVLSARKSVGYVRDFRLIGLKNATDPSGFFRRGRGRQARDSR